MDFSNLSVKGAITFNRQNDEKMREILFYLQSQQGFFIIFENDVISVQEDMSPGSNDKR